VLVGLADSTDVKAAKDLEAVLAAEPQCTVYTRMGDNLLPEAPED
jgi:4-hydroxy-tetrahydrodipicolinate reductase